MAPRLPSGEDLGSPGSYSSGRGIASYDVTPIDRGAAALGQGVQAFGNAVAGVGLAGMEKEKREGDGLEDAQARADLLTASAKRRSEISDATDPADLQKSQEAGAQADLEAAAGRIQDPRRRALFLENNRGVVTTLGIGAKDKAFNLTSDAKKAEALEQLNKLRDTAVNDQDGTAKAGYVQAGQDLISGLEKGGYITAEQAVKQRQDWAKGYAVAAIERMNPVQQLAAVRGGWEGALINRESSGNPRSVNQFGYAGLYQMGAPLMQTLGLYTPGAGEDMERWSKTGKDVAGKWSGTFKIPGYPGVRTLADYRENPEAQRAAFLASTSFYDGQIVKNGLDGFIGKAVGGVPITREGIYSMMHLGGVQGATNALKKGTNAADANGSTVLSYAKMAANAGPGSGLAGNLSGEQRMAIADRATRNLVAQDRAAQNAQANETATVRSLLKDDESSIMSTGRPLDSLTPERVAAAMGPAAATEFEQNRNQGVRYHDATRDWDDVSVDEIRARLASLKPEAGSDGFQSAKAWSDAAEKRADAIVKERRLDPAAAADRVGDVAAAKEGASLDRPESYQAVAKARAIAMEKLRIPEDLRVPMTKAEALQVWKPIDLVRNGDPRELKETLKATIEQLKAAFGDQADEAWNQVLREGHADRNTAEQAAIVLKKLARGETPTAGDMRAVDEAQKTAATDRASRSLLQQLGMDRLDEYGQPIGVEPSAAPTPTPDAEAIKMLRGKPELAPMFDRTYGPGASAKVLAIAGAR